MRISESYVAPWRAELAYSGRHDDLPCRLNDRLHVRRADTGAVVFRGSVTAISPHGVAEEGIEIVAQGARFRLEEEPVRINGASFYVWNRRGYQCTADSGEDSPGRDGGKWTAGEIILDILEHALGVPSEGSAIPGHHSSADCVCETYLTALDIVGFVASDWLALDSVVGEFSVDNTPLAFAISELLALNGGFHGWFIDAAGVLRLVDLATLPTTSVQAGELGHWQDETGTDYRLLDSRLQWSLEGVYSNVVVQGADRTVEVKPANLDSCGNEALEGGGELELVARPWRDWPCAYRALSQPYRLWAWRGVGFNGSCEDWRTTCECGIPAGMYGITDSPRIYRGTDAGAKTYLTPPQMGPNWRLNMATGIVMFYWDVPPTLGEGEKLWGWYWARRPFTVSAGPAGTAYQCLGYERTLAVYDPAFKHPTSYPTAGSPDDETAMEVLAERLLDQVKDIRIQGAIECDQADPDSWDLLKRYNVTRLSAPSGGDCSPDPMDWAYLALNAVEVVYDLERDTTVLTLANTFYLLEGYSELKRRMEMNLFARRELGLSESILSCQTQNASESEDDYATFTEPPTTTPLVSTTPGPTTLPPTTTTSEPTTTTTCWCDDCRELSDRCYRIGWSGSCGDDYSGCSADLAWSYAYPDPSGQYRCGWTGDIDCGGSPSGAVELVFHVLVGWLILHGGRAWDKDTNPLDYSNPVGDYTCTSGSGTATVAEIPCGCADLVTDDFNRADSTNLGADWDETNSGAADAQIQSNQLVVICGSKVASWTGSSVWHTQPLCTADHYVQAAWNWTFTSSGQWDILLRARATLDVGWYSARAQKNSSGTSGREILLWQVGVGSTQLASDGGAVSSGTWKFKAQGTSLGLYRNNVLQLSASDSTLTTGTTHGLQARYWNTTVGQKHLIDDYRAEII